MPNEVKVNNEFWTIYAGILLLFIFPLAVGIAFGWRWGVLAVPIFHFVFIILKMLEDNGSNTKTNN